MNGTGPTPHSGSKIMEWRTVLSVIATGLTIVASICGPVFLLFSRMTAVETELHELKTSVYRIEERMWRDNLRANFAEPRFQEEIPRNALR